MNLRIVVLNMKNLACHITQQALKAHVPDGRIYLMKGDTVKTGCMEDGQSACRTCSVNKTAGWPRSRPMSSLFA